MKLFASALMLLAASGSPFDSCGNSWSKEQAQAQANKPPVPDFCQTDPPLGCAGLCITIDMSGMGMPPPPPTSTDNCDAGGDLAKQFITDVETILVCDPNKYADMASYVVFPPYFSLTPQVVQTGTCVQPPALPDTEPLSTFMGFGP